MEKNKIIGDFNKNLKDSMKKVNILNTIINCIVVVIGISFIILEKIKVNSSFIKVPDIDKIWNIVFYTIVVLCIIDIIYQVIKVKFVRKIVNENKDIINEYYNKKLVIKIMVDIVIIIFIALIIFLKALSQPNWVMPIY